MQGVGATITSNRLVENLNPNGKLLYYKLLSQYSKRNAYMYYSKGRYVTAAVPDQIKRYPGIRTSACTVR